ncbi:MAG: monovalent cation:H+ antiporter-2, family [Solirubrobacteraceae bacterium]|jgi:CPA2 family monovalent cation:H+ antiporter-2|nr:monovalent cation:H+ antiporter-2, family [Solirubrobacteraceae bacterium]
MGAVQSVIGAVAETDTASVYLQLGAVLFVLGLAARIAGSAGLSPIPLYLLAGLLLSSFDISALDGEFVRFAANLGVILLLFVIGLEYTAEELSAHLRRFRRAGALDALLNFPPGVIFGLLLGWDPVAAILLGGITWVSSSGIVAKALSDLGWLVNRETRAIVSVLVIEDLAMAGFLPLVASLLVGGSVLASIGSLVIAAAAAVAALVGAIRFGEALGRIVAHRSEEVVLLTAMGLVLVASGVAEELQVSAAVGAFLVGIALSGEVAHRTRGLLAPIRDVNAALFFLFFALQIDTGELGGVVLPAVALAVVTALTKAITGWRAAAMAGADEIGRARAATALVARGEFSIVLAGLGAGAAVEGALAPLAACYVLILAIAGPILMHFSEHLARTMPPTLPRAAARSPR